MNDIFKIGGAWVAGIIAIATLFVIGKDQQVIGTIFDDSTKMLSTAEGSGTS